MNSKQHSRDQWSRLHPISRNALRAQYRTMRRVAQIGPRTAAVFINWSVNICVLDQLLKEPFGA